MAGSENPETRVVRLLRERLGRMGLETFKTNDRFTRGIPDIICIGKRVRLVEVKVGSGKERRTVRTYKSLGLMGSQDHTIRVTCRRGFGNACVVLGEAWQPWTVWVPIDPEHEGEGYENYALIAEGDAVFAWLADAA